MNNKVYMCVDLKCFYASVESVERGLDPFKTNLVVADPSRGSGGICLAITPAMKELGIKNRCRLFEIPKNIEYITAVPRMKLYMKYSADIYGVYLKYICKDDIHPYSIDECFIDATPYLKLYKKTAKEFARMIIDEIFKETGICATAGIGTNLFLAKIALDITAKKNKEHIAYLDEKTFKETLWHHRPITDFWNISKGIAKRLEHYGIYDLYGVAHFDKRILYKEFGVNAEFLIDHANGSESCTIDEIRNYKSKSSSLSTSQILFEDYNFDDALLVVREMVDTLTLELVEKGLVTDSIFLRIGYSKDTIKSTGGTMKIGEYTNSFKKLSEYFIEYYKKKTNRLYPIRKISVGFNNVVDENYKTITLYTDFKGEEKENLCQKSIINVKKKYGKNTILKGMNFYEKSTAIIRNKLVGGHNGE